MGEQRGATSARRRAFILGHTRLQCPPYVPELQLYLADDIIALWQQTAEAVGTGDVPPPFWAFAWVGGQAVARYLLDHPAEVAGRRVLDLAAGSGLCAIAAMRAGAAHALAADIDPLSAAAVALNARANGVRVARTDRDLLDADPTGVGVVLAGDICYEERLAALALDWLRAAHLRGARVLIGDPGRAYFSRAGLIRLADYRVPTTRDLEGVAVKRAGVFTFPTPSPMAWGAVATAVPEDAPDRANACLQSDSHAAHVPAINSHRGVGLPRV